MNAKNDAYTWIGSSGGSWGSAANWQDVTSGQDPATAVPGSGNAVTITGPTGSIYEVISGGGAAASLTLTGLLDLIGAYMSGAVSIGTVAMSSTGAMLSGGLTLGAGSSVQASTVDLADGTITLSGAGSSLSASGAVTVGTPGGVSANYVNFYGAFGTLSATAGATIAAAASMTLSEGSLSAAGAGTAVTIGGSLVLGTPAPTVSVPPYTEGSSGSVAVSGSAAVTVTGAITQYYESTISVSGSGSSLTAGGLLTLDADYASSAMVSSGGVLRAAGLVLRNSSESNYTTSLAVDSSSTVEIGSAGSATVGAITVDAGASVTATANASLNGNVVDNGTISETGGTLSVSGALSGSGQVQLGANSTLTLNGTAAASDTIAFTGAASTLTIGASGTYTYQSGAFVYTYTPYAIAATLSGFAAGDGILINNTILTNAVYTYDGNNTGTLALFAGTTTVETLNLAGNYSGRSFLVAPTTGSGSGVILLAAGGSGSDPVSTTSDSYTWIGSSGGSWGSAANWQDVTSGQDPATAVPGSGNAVTIIGPTGSIYEVISGGGAAASLTLTGLLDLIGAYMSGALSVGTVAMSSTGAMLSGGLTLGAGSSVQASTVDLADGTIALSGAGTSLSASGAVTVGTPGGVSANYVNFYGAFGTLSATAGATIAAAASMTLSEGSLSAAGAGTAVTIGGSLVLGTPAPTVSVPPYTEGSSGSVAVSGSAAVTVTGAITQYYESTISVSGSGSSLTAGGLLTLDADYASSAMVSSGGVLRAAGLVLRNSSESNYTTSLAVDSSSTVEIGSAGSATVGAITVDAGASVTATANASLNGNVVDNGTISETGGTLSVSGALSGSGQVQLGANSTLTLNGTAAASDTIAFTGAASTLTIGASGTYTYQSGAFVYTYTPYAIAATLSGFAAGDGILINNTILTNAVYTYDGNNTGTLALFAGTTTVETLNLAGNYSGRTFFISPTTNSASAVSLLAQPVGTVPGNEAVLSGIATSLSGFSVSDANTQATSITVTLSDTIGLLSANNSGGGLASGSGSGTLVILGTFAQVNADLATLAYQASTTGTDTIAVNSLDSLGSEGLEASVPVTVLPIAPPTITVLTFGLLVPKGTTGTIANVLIAYPDSAVAGEQVSVTLSDSTGQLSVDPTTAGGGGTVTGSGTGSLAITGTLPQVTADLATLTYSSTTPGLDTVTVSATGTHGGAAEPEIFTVLTNGPPAIENPVSTTVRLSQATAIAGVSISETPLIPSETFTVTLSDTRGELKASGTGVSGSGTTNLTITGLLGFVQDDLATLTDTDAIAASDTITLNVTDSYGGTAGPNQIAVTVQDLAEPQVNTATPINFGSVRIGTALTRAISISNIAPPGSEGLNVSATATGQATVTGSISELAAGAAADKNDIVAGLSTADVGVESGVVTLDYTSQNAGGPIHQPATASSQIDLSATVYAEASAVVSAGAPVFFHVGDAGTGMITVTDATGTPYAEALVASVSGSSGVVTLRSTTTAEIAALQSGTIGYSVPTNKAGTIDGTVTLSFASDGVGTDGAPLTAIGTQTITLSATILNYATAAVIAVSGAGTLSGSNGVYTLDLGDVEQGEAPLTEDLGIENTAGAIADVLAGKVAASGDAAIGFGGPYNFAQIGAQQSVDGINLSLATGVTGVFTKTIVVDASGSDAYGYVGPDQQETVVVTGTVLPQPGFDVLEPNAAVLHVGDPGAGSIGITNTASLGSTQDLVASVLSTPLGVTTPVTATDPIAPQGTTDLGYIVDTSRSGTIEGSIDLSFVSNAAGSATPLGTLDVPVQATIYNYATAEVLAPGIDVTTNGANTVLNLGTFTQGEGAQSVDLAIENSATGLADRLSGTLSLSSNNGFSNTGSGTFSNVAAGYATYVDNASINLATAGTFTETFELTASGSDDGGYAGALPDQTITVEATVLPVVPPQITAAPTVAVVQGTPSVVPVSVVDTGTYTGETFTATVSDSYGLLSASGDGVSGSGTTSLSITGALADVNAALVTLTDTDASTSADQLAIQVTDGLRNASTTSVVVTVTALVPQLIGPTSLTVIDGVPTTLGVSMAEPGDFAGNTVTATVADTYGTLAIASGSGATVTASVGGHGLSITGSSQQINAALATVTDTYSASASDTVAVSVVDSFGNTASTSIAVTSSTPQATMSPALFDAILAMDSYNRGYLATVSGLLDTNGIKIGDATITGSDPDSFTGFYALSYSYNGTTVISYRGTQPLSVYNTLADILAGWLAGGGVLTPQVAEAISFYKKATDLSLASGYAPNVLLIGHSLGGGLAGIIATLTGDNAQVFDAMPYGAAAMLTFLAYDLTAAGANTTLTVANWLALLGGLGGVPVGPVPYLPLPNGTRIMSEYTSGEILSGVRTLATPAAFLTGLSGYGGPIVGAVAAAAAWHYQNQASTTPLNAYQASVGLNPFNIAGQAISLHSMPLLVLLQYASDKGDTVWQTVGADLFSAYNNNSLGDAVGLSVSTGAGSTSAQMLTMIAYSAVNQGEQPFGDTGIVALFNGADALGHFYKDSLSSALTNPSLTAVPSVSSDLAQIAVEYAGLLAYKKDEITADAKGVITYSEDDQVLFVDLSKSAWTIGGASAPDIVGLQGIESSLFGTDTTPENASSAYDLYFAADAPSRTIDLSDSTGTDLIFAGAGSTFIVGTGTTYVAAGGGTDAVEIDDPGNAFYFTGSSGSSTVDASDLTSDERIDVTPGLSGTISVLMGDAETLQLNRAVDFKGSITGFEIGNVIDLAGIDADSATLMSGDVLEVHESFDGGGFSLTDLQLVGDYSTDDFFDISPDDDDGTDVRVASLSITPVDPDIQEGSVGSEEFTITRTGDLSGSSTVYVSTEDPDGDNTRDFTPLTNLPVMFAAGSATTTFDVTIGDGDTSGETKTFGLQATDAATGPATILGTDSFTVVALPTPPEPPGPPTAGGLGCPHFTTFDGLEFDFQGAGEFIAAKSTVSGDSFQVQMRIEPEFGIDSAVSIISQIAVQVGKDRVTFDPDRAADYGSGAVEPVSSPSDSLVVWVDGTPVMINANNPVFTLDGGTVTQVSQYEYRVALNTGEVVTIDPFGDGMGLSIALAPDAQLDSIEGFFGSDKGQADAFQLPDGTVLGSNLTQDQLYQQFANSWRVTDSNSLLDYTAGQTTATFTDTQYPREVLTLADFSPDIIAAAAAVVAAAGITDPTLFADAEFDYITMGSPSFVVEDATAASLTPTLIENSTPAVVTTPVLPAPSIGVMASMAQLVESAGAVTPVTFNVELTSAVTSDTIVDYVVISGAGAAIGKTYFDAADFGGTLPFGSVTITAGQTMAAVTIDVPASALGTATDKWLMVSIDSPAGNALYDPTAQTDIINNAPVAGTPAQPAIKLLSTSAPSPTEIQPSLTQVANSYTVDLGQVLRGAAVNPLQFAIANTAPAPADDLQSMLEAATGNGFYVYGATLPSTISAGSAYQNLEITPDVTIIGANSQTLTLVSSDANATGYSASLPDLTLTLEDNIIAPAEASLGTGAIAFGNARVGTTESQALSVTNTASAGAASLDVSLTSAGDATAGGAVAMLAAGGTDETDLSAGLATASAGLQKGTVEVNFFSDLGNGVEIPALPSDSIAITGSIYREASAGVGSANTIFHVADAGTAVLTVTNTAAADGYSESLIASLTGMAGQISATTDSVTGEIAAGHSDDSTFSVTFSTSQAGAESGSVTLALASDGGLGSDSIDGLGQIDLAPQTLAIGATVDNYAVAALVEQSGGGSLTHDGNAYTLDLGTLASGSSTASVVIGLANTALGTADSLGGSFDIDGDDAFSNLGFDSLSGIEAGAQHAAGTITVSTASVGRFEETITLHGAGTNDSGYSGALPDETLTITADVVPCYCPGTLIRTDGGEVPVEALAIGDRVVTINGSSRDIRWIGRRSYAGALVAGRPLMLPVCIKADALAPGLPWQDLWVSPGHAMFLDGQLVPAWRLINGVSIVQADHIDTVTYIHVELDRHDVIFANGAPAESFLDDDCRDQFQNATSFHDRYPETTPQTPFAARLEDGFALRCLQSRINRRAGLADTVRAPGAMRGFIDIATPEMLCGWVQDETALEHPVPLTILVDQRPIMSILSNRYRADLYAAGLGSGCHSFGVTLPHGLSGAIEVIRATDGMSMDCVWSALMQIEAEIAA